MSSSNFYSFSFVICISNNYEMNEFGKILGGLFLCLNDLWFLRAFRVEQNLEQISHSYPGWSTWRDSMCSYNTDLFFVVYPQSRQFQKPASSLHDILDLIWPSNAEKDNNNNIFIVKIYNFYKFKWFVYVVWKGVFWGHWWWDRTCCRDDNWTLTRPCA